MKLLSAAMLLTGVALGYIGLIYGWGLTPVSWPWIIGTSIASLICIGIGQVCAAD